MAISHDDIWNRIVDSLPAGMIISEYKNYILGLLFYRFLSESQEQYLLKNGVVDVADGRTVNEAYAAEANDESLNDYLEDISASLGYSISPDDTWATITEKIENGRIIPSEYQAIFENFNNNAQLNKESRLNIQSIFEDLDLGNTRLGSDTTARAKSLSKIVKVIDSIEYGSDICSVFDDLIQRFAASAGKTGGKFYTPRSVSQLLARIVADGVIESDETFTVYDPTCGSGSTMLALKDAIPGGKRSGAVKYYGQEKERTTYNLARMNVLLNGISYSNSFLSNADTLGGDWPDGVDAYGKDHPRVFDAVVADIEFGKGMSWENDISKLKDPRFQKCGVLAPKGKPDYAFVLHGLYHLNEAGTMAMVLPHGVLFRGSAEGIIRKNLIEHSSGNKIYAVIGLPENIMFSEKGKKSVAVVIMVLKKKRDGSDILFIDASADFEKGKNKNFLSEDHIQKIIDAYHRRASIDRYAQLASIEEIRKNEYNLNIPRYISSVEQEPEIDLDEVNRCLDEDDAEIAAVKTQVEATLVALGVRR